MQRKSPGRGRLAAVRCARPDFIQRFTVACGAVVAPSLAISASEGCQAWACPQGGRRFFTHLRAGSELIEATVAPSNWHQLQSLTVSSSLAVARSVPSGLNAAPITAATRAPPHQTASGEVA